MKNTHVRSNPKLKSPIDCFGLTVTKKWRTFGREEALCNHSFNSTQKEKHFNVTPPRYTSRPQLIHMQSDADRLVAGREVNKHTFLGGDSHSCPRSESRLFPMA